MSLDLSQYQPYVDAMAACQVAKETYGSRSPEAQAAADAVIEHINAGHVAAGLADPEY